MDKWFRPDTPVTEREVAVQVERRLTPRVAVALEFSSDQPPKVLYEREWEETHPRCCE